MGGRTAAPLAAALWLGALAGRAVGVSVALTAAGALLLAAFLTRRSSRQWAWALLVAGSLAAGAARGAAHRESLDRTRALVQGGRLYRLRIEVDGPPALATDHVSILARIRASSPRLPAGTLLRVRLPADARPEWADRLECLAWLDLPSAPRNPGGFDPRASANAAGWAASARAATSRELPPSFASRLLRATLVRWRRGIERRLRAGLSPTAYSLVLPLVTGDRSDLSPELDADLRAAGLIHLLALSGLHVSALAAVARMLVASAGGGVGARGAAGALAALLYTGLAGPIPSLMRAAVSEVWLGWARMTRRSADPLQGLGVSALILLAVAPGWAGDLGFQLSFAASLGLAALSPPLIELAGRPGIAGARRAAAPIAATLAAQITSAPILIAWTHGLSWPGVLANLVAVPLSGLLLAAAWLAALFEAAFPGAGQVAFSACELLSRALIVVTERAAGFRGALIATGHEPAVAWLAAAGAVLLVLGACSARDLESSRRERTLPRFAALALGAWCSTMSAALALSARAPHPAPGCAWLVVLDVGQGDALALAFADGWWLVDTGSRSPHFDAGESVIRPFLRWAAVRRLEALALTHDDGDHTGGAAALLRALPVVRLIGPPPLPGRPGPLARFEWALAREAPAASGSRRLADRPPRFVFASAGETLRESPRVRVEWPPDSASDSISVACAMRSDNAAGLVLAIEAGEARALLLADVDSLVENALADTSRVGLLKVGHHGSPSSTGVAFLKRIRPQTAVISCGAHNPYGHPSPAVLERLEASCAELRRTDLSGAAWFELSDRGVRELDWRRLDPTSTAESSRGPAKAATAGLTPLACGVAAPRDP